jgi:hypothetical protein
VLEPEARSSSGIDFNDARDPEKIGMPGHVPGLAVAASAPNQTEGRCFAPTRWLS